MVTESASGRTVSDTETPRFGASATRVAVSALGADGGVHQLRALTAARAYDRLRQLGVERSR